MNTAQGIIAILCIALFVWCVVSPGGSQDEQIMPALLRWVAVIVLLLDGFVFLLRHVNWGGLFR